LALGIAKLRSRQVLEDLGLLLLSALLLASLIVPGLANENSNKFFVFGVSYQRQEDPYWCGPASLAMVLNYWGLNATQQEVAGSVYDPSRNITTMDSMATYPMEIGFQTQTSTSNITYIRTWISQGVPVIVLQRYSESNPYGHYRVIVGYDDDDSYLITYDPINGGNYNITYGLFAELWKPGPNSTFDTTNWTLIILPRNEELLEFANRLQSLLNDHASNLAAAYLAVAQLTNQRGFFMWVIGVESLLLIILFVLCVYLYRKASVSPISRGHGRR